MKRLMCTAILLAAALCAQVPAPELSQNEQDSLRQALSEAGGSPVDFLKAIEGHLAKFPNSPRRIELQRAILKSTTDVKDDDRIVKYGEQVLAKEPDDAQILERVSAALLRRGDKPSAERALKYIVHFREILKAAVNDRTMNGRDEAKMRDGADRATSRGMILHARAEGILGNYAKAADLAEQGFAVYPSVESAREASKWLNEAGKTEESIRYLARAFSIAELKATDADAARDRARLGALYKKWKGSEAGLGDLVLQAYDQTSAVFQARHDQFQALDPNSFAKEPLQFTLTGLQNEKLPLVSLKGKVIVMDFWATWCGPCRIQHPLYEQVKERFKNRDDVVFLAIDTDEDHSVVKPFLEQSQWSQKVYFEDGLSRLLQVTSIPMTLILDRKGEVSSRMNGFVPERFVDMLTERINEALQAPGSGPAPKLSAQ